MLPFEITPDTWIISDTHFGHANIRRLTNRPDGHEWLMRAHWLEMVGRRDTVLHLGDLAYRGSDEYLSQFLHGLPGNKYLLPGNHDKKMKDWYKRYGFILLEDQLLKLIETETGRTIRHTGFYWHDDTGRRVLFSHYPDMQCKDWTINVHGHTHGRENEYLPQRDYRDVSVERTGYAPVRLRDVLANRYVVPA